MNVLALNAGSDSLRSKLVAVGGERVLRDEYRDHARGPQAADAARRAVADSLPLGVAAVGVRVVHGGDRFADPVRVTPDVVAALRELVPLAPLHLPTDLLVIEAARAAAPGVPVVAVFDTAFHRTLPEVARRYAVPHDLGPLARRYGFHGISYADVTRRLLDLLDRPAAGSRLVLLHLGGGCSGCAVRDGRSVATSMGVTPLAGLVMGTRCGDYDPGAVLELVRQGKTADELEDLLYRKGGLLGLSGRTADVRALEPAAAAGDERAAFALDLFADRARQLVGAYAVALGGLDAVAVTGAVAENSAGVRRRVLSGLEVLGVRLDEARNAAAGPHAPAVLSPDGSPVPAWLVPTDEEREIARQVAGLLRAA